VEWYGLGFPVASSCGITTGRNNVYVSRLAIDTGECFRISSDDSPTILMLDSLSTLKMMMMMMMNEQMQEWMMPMLPQRGD